MTLTFDLDVKMIGHQRCIHPKWSDVATIYGSKVINYFLNSLSLSGAITSIRGHRIIFIKPVDKDLSVPNTMVKIPSLYVLSFLSLIHISEPTRPY